MKLSGKENYDMLRFWNKFQSDWGEDSIEGRGSTS